ncbi:putative ATPase/DNA-binding CsgD family transcriptional regulator [Deinococcus metalli]|uniref:Putative ATPase/DNA-binding CsgD family transcriptional regulator n=1 Tax=Deinococcus metalli TaxID=1141878 RepID=A0A7W8KGQ5_9DEIO|nr:LuxR C-terminal-related transcriptional regulator [Deinococcus metalli]MBB5376214.1 putative ATPase/DNA-binding CsgD family transcriptional regulator [Deinococcus metalli]GHF39925.1 hypothetical protein GCM10017781_15680 [Deinococcus metalli]
MDVQRWTERPGTGEPALVGRDVELVLAGDLLLQPDVRVVVLRGPGGVGKTRVAREVQRLVHARFERGAVFVNLAPLAGPDQVLPAVAHALGVRDGSSPLDALEQAVGDRSVLLILDNLEHLPGTEGDIVALCARLPGARILATSRRVLRVRHARELPLPPLALPARPQDAARSPAVQLFVQRAQEVEPEFALTPDNAATVSAVCTALGGLPLALELAAARLRAVDVAGLLAWLDTPLDVLDGGPLDDAPRARSLRDAVRWSYDLLSTDEQAVFTACGGFRGGFTLDALEAVTGRPDARTILIALVEHSLIRRTEGTPARWTLLEPVREFAAEVLRDSPHATDVAERHARFYLALAAAGNPEHGAGRDWLNRVHVDHTNIVTALEHFIARQAVPEAQQLVSALFDYWSTQGRFEQGVALCRRVLALPGDLVTAERATLLTTAALMASRAERHHDAEAWCQAALAIRRALGDPREEAGAMSILADVLSNTGTYGQAIDLFREALALAEAHGDVAAQAHTLHNLGFALEKTGAYPACVTYLDRALALWTALGQPVGEAYTSAVRARVTLLHRDVDPEQTHLRRAWAVGRHVDDVVLEEALLYITSLLADRRGQPSLAVRLAAASVATGQRSEGVLPGGCHAERQHFIEDWRAAMPEHQFAAAWSAGATAAPDAWAADVECALRAVEPTTAAPPLTARELEVLAWVARGHSDKKVALTLGISAGTVGKHVASMLGKLELHNRVELARFALDHRLIPVEDSGPVGRPSL